MNKYTFEQIPFVLERIEDQLESLRIFFLESEHQLKDSKDFLNIREASQLINLTVSTIYSKVSRREIPVCKKGKQLYFSKKELLDWIMDGRRKTRTDYDQLLKGQ
ncbi:helix-turn-helix domain-containing protein [Chryseobacterium sp. ISL-6]|uniref:helix-turn-helix domain-containing protein n=1 Tax=Chryseobacterium sp. ISL-6 TaxID=2819143 RepID=UPI001BE6D8F4|nr:helix-turn-helix domain-containing protein [Chryseobacterium sp. ISL-6]MBT2620609.1 helix-turn-helix domain-containing protein [Chryseobacterium sp. ISL-6]